MSQDYVKDLREDNDTLRGIIIELREVNARANQMIADISDEYGRFVKATLQITTSATVSHLRKTAGKYPSPSAQ